MYEKNTESLKYRYLLILILGIDSLILGFNSLALEKSVKSILEILGWASIYYSSLQIFPDIRNKLEALWWTYLYYSNKLNKSPISFPSKTREPGFIVFSFNILCVLMKTPSLIKFIPIVYICIVYYYRHSCLHQVKEAYGPIKVFGKFNDFIYWSILAINFIVPYFFFLYGDILLKKIAFLKKSALFSLFSKYRSIPLIFTFGYMLFFIIYIKKFKFYKLPLCLMLICQITLFFMAPLYLFVAIALSIYTY